ncbi:hypothetical protein TrRE_jg11856, partial [Triparma retinervis]
MTKIAPTEDPLPSSPAPSPASSASPHPSDSVTVPVEKAATDLAEAPTPEAPTPEVPNPEVPNPEVPTPEVPTDAKDGGGEDGTKEDPAEKEEVKVEGGEKEEETKPKEEETKPKEPRVTKDGYVEGAEEILEGEERKDWVPTRHDLEKMKEWSTDNMESMRYRRIVWRHPQLDPWAGTYTKRDGTVVVMADYIAAGGKCNTVVAANGSTCKIVCEPPLKTAW